MQELTGGNPVDRGKPGSKYHLLIDATGIPLAVGCRRSLAWLLANRRLTVRYERRAEILTALLHLACALICARKLRPW